MGHYTELISTKPRQMRKQRGLIKSEHENHPKYSYFDVLDHFAAAIGAPLCPKFLSSRSQPGKRRLASANLSFRGPSAMKSVECISIMFFGVLLLFSRSACALNHLLLPSSGVFHESHKVVRGGVLRTGRRDFSFLHYLSLPSQSSPSGFTAHLLSSYVDESRPKDNKKKRQAHHPPRGFDAAPKRAARRACRYCLPLSLLASFPRGNDPEDWHHSSLPENDSFLQDRRAYHDSCANFTGLILASTSLHPTKSFSMR